MAKKGRPKKKFTFIERQQINQLQMHFIEKIIEKMNIEELHARSVICNFLLSW